MNISQCFLAIAVCFVQFVAVSENPLLADDSTAASNQWITFLSHRSGTSFLYRMRPDGSEMTAILGGEIEGIPTIDEELTLVREPHWTRLSPNSRYFASWVYEKGVPYSKWQGSLRASIVVGDIHGEWTRLLHPSAHEEFTWSPDSMQIAFCVFSGKRSAGELRSKLRSTQVITSGFDGSNEKVVLEEPGIVVVLDWSPDGKRLLLSRRLFDITPETSSGLFELDLETGQCLPYLLSGTKEFSAQTARYSPSGSDIAVLWTNPRKQYAPNECSTDEFYMMRMLGKLSLYQRDGINGRLLSDYPYGQRGPICWSPDGKSVLVSRYLPPDDNREAFDGEHGLGIWAVQTDGSGENFITTGWSPDWH